MLNYLVLKTPKQILGKKAEDQAVQLLQERGFTIMFRNYRYSRAEIDVIAKKDNLLLFVEVKARSGNCFGHPEEFVSLRQQELLIEAAENYISENDWNYDVRFDVISVIEKNNQTKIRHFEDAFY